MPNEEESVTKPLIPLALGVALLGGCATMNAFNELKTSVTDNGIVMARAITLTNKAHVYLTWYRPGSAVTSITRHNGSSIEANLAPAANLSFVEDTATPDLRTDLPYSYDLNFSVGSKVTRFITPISAVSETATLNEPVSNIIPGLNLQAKKPTFKWTRLSSVVDGTKALAYMLTVAELDPATFANPSSFKFTADAAKVKYSALIDPSKHAAGNLISIELGAKSDIPLATELLDAIGKAGSGSTGNLSALSPKDGDKTEALEANKFYAWTVTPIVYTLDQTAFAMGNMATPFFFQVQ